MLTHRFSANGPQVGPASRLPAGGMFRWPARATATSARNSSPAVRAARGIGGLGGNNVKPGDVTVPPTPIPQEAAYVAVRKVKNLLIGMPPDRRGRRAGDHQRRRRVAAAGREAGRRPTPYQGPVRGQDGRLLPQRLPADRLHPDRGLQAAAADQRRLRLRPGRRAPAGDDAFPRLVQNLRTASRRPPGRWCRRGARSPRC